MIDYIKTWFLSKRSEQGQDLAEYALLIGLNALIVIVAITLLGNNISTIFDAIANNISTWNIGT